MNRTCLFFIITSAIILTSCGKSNNLSDLKQYIQQLNTRPVTPLPLAPLPKMDTSISLVTSHATLQRDPFAPYINPKTLANRPDVGREKETLENFPLNSLKMMGTVVQGQQHWALIHSPDGLYRITKGQYIGQNSGEVVKITDNDISIRELIPESNGQWGKRIIKLALSGNN